MIATEIRQRELDAFRRASDSLLSLIRGEHLASRTPAARRQRAEARLARGRALLRALGEPQRAFPAVHITGTSGKGSTAATIAAMLTAAGYRVGLRTSPYLQVPTEKLQIGHTLIDARSLEDLVPRVWQSGLHIGYAEAWTAISMMWFAERAVDIAVIEVGAGGRFDATNVVEPLVSVITSVGLDHVVSLGPTLQDIAWHKAGIIKPGSIAILGPIPPDLLPIFAREADLVGASLCQVDMESEGDIVEPSMAGQFQQANARIAMAVVQALAGLGFPISPGAARAGMHNARLPGRLERMPGVHEVAVWLDGAHNEDKIAAVAAEAGRIAPPGRSPVIVVGAIASKDSAAITARLAPVASAFVTTQPTVLGKQSKDAGALAELIGATGFSGPVNMDRSPASAVRQAESLAAHLGTSVLVTGSLYLAGEVRGRWYPGDEIVLQRTPWPNQVADEP